MSGAIAGRVAAWLSRLDWPEWEPRVRARVGEAHAHLELEWSEGDIATRIDVRLLVEDTDRVWCATLDRALREAQAPGTATIDGRPLVAEPTLVPWGEA